MASDSPAPDAGPPAAPAATTASDATTPFERFGPIAALVAFAAVAGTLRIKAYDLFWHLAAGRYMLQQGEIPRHDPFRFTHDGVPWVDHEWLFQLLVAVFEGLVGIDGLVVARTLLVVGLALLLLVQGRRSGVPTAWAVPVATLALFAARPRLFLRPELVTLTFLVLHLSLLQGLRRTGSGGRFAADAGEAVRPPLAAWLPGAAALVALTLLWVNLHPGALAAPPLALAFLVGSRLPGGRGAPHRGTVPPPWTLVVGLPAALALALVVNPFGTHVFAVPGSIGSALDRLPGVNPEWLPVWRVPEPATTYFLGLAVVVALAGIALVRARRLDPATLLVVGALAGLGATSLRHGALFFVGAAFFAFECLADLARATGGPRRPRRAAALAVLIPLLAAVWCLAPPAWGPLAPRQGVYQTGFGIEPDRFPEAAVDRLERWQDEVGEVGPLYNNVAWGGYLLWRTWPPRQVFIDGRNEVDPELLHAIGRSRFDARAWEELLARHGVDGAIVRYEDRPYQLVTPSADPSGQPTVEVHTPNALLFPRERFALVHWDDAGMFYLLRTPERAAVLEAVEYRAVHPENWRRTLARAATDPAFRARAEADVERRLAEEPECERARFLAERLAELGG